MPKKEMALHIHNNSKWNYYNSNYFDKIIQRFHHIGLFFLTPCLGFQCQSCRIRLMSYLRKNCLTFS